VQAHRLSAGRRSSVKVSRAQAQRAQLRDELADALNRGKTQFDWPSFTPVPVIETTCEAPA